MSDPFSMFLLAGTILAAFLSFFAILLVAGDIQERRLRKAHKTHHPKA